MLLKKYGVVFTFTTSLLTTSPLFAMTDEDDSNKTPSVSLKGSQPTHSSEVVRTPTSILSTPMSSSTTSLSSSTDSDGLSNSTTLGTSTTSTILSSSNDAFLTEPLSLHSGSIKITKRDPYKDPTTQELATLNTPLVTPDELGTQILTTPNGSPLNLIRLIMETNTFDPVQFNSAYAEFEKNKETTKREEVGGSDSEDFNPDTINEVYGWTVKRSEPTLLEKTTETVSQLANNLLDPLTVVSTAMHVGRTVQKVVSSHNEILQTATNIGTSLTSLANQGMEQFGNMPTVLSSTATEVMGYTVDKADQVATVLASLTSTDIDKWARKTTGIFDSVTSHTTESVAQSLLPPLSQFKNAYDMYTLTKNVVITDPTNEDGRLVLTDEEDFINVEKTNKSALEIDLPDDEGGMDEDEDGDIVDDENNVVVEFTAIPALTGTPKEEEEKSPS